MTKPEGTRRPDNWRAAVFFYALCVTVGFVLLLERKDAEGAVSRRAADQSRARLQELAARLVVRTGPNASDEHHTLTLTFSSPCGAFQGALSDAAGGAQLWFTVDGSRPRFFLDPSRAELPSLLVARHDPLSRLVGRGGRHALFVGMSREGEKRASPERAAIDNLRGGQSAFTISGRDLEPLADPARCMFNEADLRTFALLARLLRARACAEPGDERCESVTVFVWREPLPQRFGFELVTESGSVDGHFDIAYRDGGIRAATARWALHGSRASLSSRLRLALAPAAAPAGGPIALFPRVELVHDPATPRDQEIDVSFAPYEPGGAAAQ